MNFWNRNPPIRPRLWLGRAAVGLAVAAAIGGAGYIFAKAWTAARPAGLHTPWFAPYVDVTTKQRFPFEQQKTAVLSFVVSSPSQPCSPSWGGRYSLPQAKESLGLDQRIARLQQHGGTVVVAFGGQTHRELSLDCTDPGKLEAAYQSVVSQYHTGIIDLDLEKDGLTDHSAGVRRAKALAKLQRDRRAEGRPLAIWVTLPINPEGLTQAGTSAVATLLTNGVDLDGVNVMTMDYGQSLRSGTGMEAAAESALAAAHKQLAELYRAAGQPLDDTAAWRKLGATPMVGQNDIQDEVFSLADAKSLNQFGRSHNLGRMSMWSANRDVACSGGGGVNTKATSSCSGVNQNKSEFAEKLGEDFYGHY